MQEVVSLGSPNSTSCVFFSADVETRQLFSL